MTPGVDHHGTRASRDSNGLTLEQDAGDALAGAHRHRHRPDRRVVRSVEGEPALAEHHAISVEGGLHQRVARLPNPRIHDATHRLTGGLLDRVPEIGRLRARVGMTLEIVRHPLAEPFGTEVLLEHAEQRATLLVGEHVEHPLRIGG